MADAKSNIGNELGHTIYPKWVDSKEKDENGKAKRIIVNNEEEEKNLAAPVSNKSNPANKSNKDEGWTK